MGISLLIVGARSMEQDFALALVGGILIILALISILIAGLVHQHNLDLRRKSF
jgi:hypothetical protein